MRPFRAVTTLLATVLVISAVLHLALLASDSAEYRHWVQVQLVLHLLGVWLLWHVRKFRFCALLGLAVVSVPAVYVNARYLNYGNGPVLWLVPLLFWFIYGRLAFLARSEFKAGAMSQDT